jgi:hypothetical protein
MKCLPYFLTHRTLISACASLDLIVTFPAHDQMSATSVIDLHKCVQTNGTRECIKSSAQLVDSGICRVQLTFHVVYFLFHCVHFLFHCVHFIAALLFCRSRSPSKSTLRITIRFHWQEPIFNIWLTAGAIHVKSLVL